MSRSMKSAAVIGFAFLGLILPSAVQGATWTGAENGFWTNANNWVDHQIGGRYLALNDEGVVVTNGVMAAETDTVYFNTAGIGGATTIDFDGVVSVSNLIVTGGPTVPRYTFGVHETQKVPILSNGKIVVADSSDTTMAVLGGAIAGPIHATATGNNGDPVTVCNNSATETLVLTNWGGGATSPNGAAGRQNAWTFDGSGRIRLDRDSSHSGSHQYRFKMSGTLEINCIFKKVRYFQVRGAYAHHLYLHEGAMFCHQEGAVNNLSLDNGASYFVDGPGVYAFASAKSGIWLNGTLGMGNTAVRYDSPVTALPSSGTLPADWFPGIRISSGTAAVEFKGENNVTGTVEVLSGATLVCSRLGLKGTRGSHGWGNFRVDGATIRFTGTEADTTDRDFSVTNASNVAEHKVILEQAGTAELRVESAFDTEPNVTGAHALVLAGENAAAATFAGSLETGYALRKQGSGTWRLASALAHTGGTEIEAGRFEVVEGGALPATEAVALSGDATLAFSTSGACPTLNVSGGAARLEVEAGREVTIAGFSMADTGSLDIIPADKTAIVKMAAGVTALPTSVTINGMPAEIGADGRVKELTNAIDTEIAAHGGRIPNDAAKNVGITTAGNAADGDIRLETGNAAAVKSLVQKTAETAVVNLNASDTLTAGQLAAEEFTAPLVIGNDAGEGTFAAAAGDLTLWSDGEESVITVRATPQLTAATSIVKLGDGFVEFLKDFDYARTIDLGAGELVVVPSATKQNFTLAGDGTFVKAGNAAWTVPAGKNENFQGDYVVRGGEVTPGANKMQDLFGAEDGGALVITNGAVLKTHANAAAVADFGNKSVRLSGTGADGKGAVSVNSTAKEVGFSRVTLDGDAALNVPGSCKSYTYLSRDGYLNMQGNALTRRGSGRVALSNTTVSNAGEVVLHGPETTGALDLRGYFGFIGKVEYPDGPGSLRVAGDNVVINLQANYPPLAMPITLERSATVLVNKIGAGTNFNHIAGNIELQGADTILTVAADDGQQVLTLSGVISGEGSLVQTNKTGTVFLANKANTYTGTTDIRLNNGSGGFSTCGIAYDTTLPSFEKTTVGAGSNGDDGIGAVALMVSKDRTSWPDASIGRFIRESTIKGYSIVGIDPVNSGDYEITASGLGENPVAKHSFGAAALMPTNKQNLVTLLLDRNWGNDNFRLGAIGGRLRVTGAYTLDVNILRVSGMSSYATGELELVGGVNVVQHSTTSSSIGTHDGVIAVLRVANASFGGSADNPYPKLSLGGVNTSQGTMEVQAGANVVCNLSFGGHVGNRGSSLHQTGGNVEIGGTSSLANNGASVWMMTGGTAVMAKDGQLRMGYANSNACARLEINGGAFTDNSAKASPFVGGRKNAQSHILMTGGTLKLGAALTGKMTLAWPHNDKTDHGSTGTITLDGENALMELAEDSCITLGAQKNGLGIINLNAGTLAASDIAGNEDASIEGARGYVNFNGGTLKAKSDACLGAGALALTLGEKGGVIDTGVHTVELAKPIAALAGGGVAAIEWAGYDRVVTAYKVEITGDGDGAAAVTEYDPATRRITGIRVISPGSGYTYATARVSCACARESSNLKLDGTNPWIDLPCTIAPNGAPGTLVKRGEGVLKLHAGDGLAAGMKVEVTEGTLDLNGLENELGNIGGAGTVMNSAAATVALPSTLTVDIPTAAGGKYLTVTGDVQLPATLVLANIDKVPESTATFTILKVTGAKTGDMTLATELPAGWMLGWTGSELRVGRVRGMRIIFR